jgi:hypothetical protein
MKAADVRNLARDYYVKYGFSVDTIVRLLPSKVNRKTVYNWRAVENWDKLREEFVDRGKLIEDQAYEILRTALNKLEADINPKTSLSALRTYTLHEKIISSPLVQARMTPDKKDEHKGISDRTKKLIEEKLGVKIDEDEDDSED